MKRKPALFLHWLVGALTCVSLLSSCGQPTAPVPPSMQPPTLEQPDKSSNEGALLEQASQPGIPYTLNTSEIANASRIVAPREQQTAKSSGTLKAFP